MTALEAPTFGAEGVLHRIRIVAECRRLKLPIVRVDGQFGNQKRENSETGPFRKPGRDSEAGTRDSETRGVDSAT